MIKRILSLMIMLLLFCSVAVSASASHPVPDLTRNGSITFVMDWNGELMDGGNLNLYKVGLISEDDGNYFFSLAPELEGSDLMLDNVDDPLLAEELLTLAKALRFTKLSAPIQDGTAVFSDLAPGLYVVFQNSEDATKGFATIQPFLISIPKFQNNEYVLDVIADPKVPLETVPPTTAPPPPKDPNLPQTGQLNWPVPVMAVSGAVLLILGFVLWAGRKKAHNAG